MTDLRSAPPPRRLRLHHHSPARRFRTHRGHHLDRPSTRRCCLSASPIRRRLRHHLGAPPVIFPSRTSSQLAKLLSACSIWLFPFLPQIPSLPPISSSHVTVCGRGYYIGAEHHGFTSSYLSSGSSRTDGAFFGAHDLCLCFGL